LIFLLALAAFAAAAIVLKRLRSDVASSAFWGLLFAAAAGLSAASALVSHMRRAGTGFTTSYGWPKPFYFRYLSETGERSDGFHAVYFGGNSLAWAAPLLIGWIVWRAVGSRR
jgi:hypothetical protein